MTSPATSFTARPLGGFEPLLRAEALILQAFTVGAIAKVAFRRPPAASPDVLVRAEFLAFLARGGAGMPTSEGPGLQVLGAWIGGRLNLIEATVPMSLWLYRCGFAATPLLDGAHVVGDVSFPDCALPGLRAQGCRIAGSLALNAGCSVDGAVRLERATVGGDLDFDRAMLCVGATSTNTPRPLVADDARIGGHVSLRGGLRAHGEVRLVGARVRGDLLASQASLTAAVDAEGCRGIALNLDAIEVAGSVRLDAGFTAGGQVRLHHAHIEGDLDCTDAAFDVVGDVAWNGGAAVLLDRAWVGGSLVLRQLQTPLQGGSLIDARAGALADDASTWGQQHVLDGFAYGRLGDGAPTDGPARLDWLMRQYSPHLSESYRPEPWRQLISVLRQMGHGASAGDVAIGRERQLRHVGRIGAAVPAAGRWLVRGAHALFGAFAGYGHRPLRLVAWLAAVWVVCGAAYWSADERGLIVPTRAAMAGDVTRRCNSANSKLQGSGCADQAPGTPQFSPFVHSLEVLLPGLDLRQQHRWVPVADTGWGAATRALIWAEAMCGWLGGLTLFAVLAGLTDRDRRR